MPPMNESFDLMILEVLYAQLRAMGLGGMNESLTEWKARLSVLPLYDRWITESLSLLQDSGHLRGMSDRVVMLAAADPNEIWQRWEQEKFYWDADPTLKGQAFLAEKMLCNLSDILVGRRGATELLFPNSSMELVEPVYSNNPAADYFNGSLAEMICTHVTKRSEVNAKKFKILEIGAGTGATSAQIFQKLLPLRDRIEEYCYTDLSVAFLQHAERKYRSIAPYLRCKIFDVEKPLSEQGLDVGCYDLVVATNVIHATRNVCMSLRNAKAALKPNGLLLLNEITSKKVFAHVTFGLLSGWWLYEDEALRIGGSPLLSGNSWRNALEREGFHSIGFPAKSDDMPGQEVIVAASNGIIRQRAASNKASAPVSPLKTDRAASKSGFIHTGEQNPVTPVGVRRENIRPIPSREREMCQLIRETIVEALKLDESKVEDNRNFADLGVDSIIAVQLVNQISRRCELILPATVIFDYNTVEALARHILLKKQPSVEKSRAEERKLENKATAAVLVERASDRISEHVEARHAGNESPDSRLSGREHYYKVLIKGPGSVDDVVIVKAEIPAVGEHEVQIAVAAFSLNFGDLLCARGLYPNMPPYPFTPGFEVSGIVVRAGASVTKVVPGDEVIGTMWRKLGGHATLAICHEDWVLRKPTELSFEEACSLPAAAITMIHAFSMVNLAKGEKVLIQTAAGGTGLVGVQLAQNRGAEVYATAGSEEKLRFLAGQGVQHLINYRTTDFEEEIHRLTVGRGVDVVINTLPRDAMQKGMRCLTAGGRYVELAMTALKKAKSVDLSILNDNQQFHSVDLARLAQSRPESIRRYQEELIQLTQTGRLRPTIARTFPFDQLKRAYACLESRENIGKVVVSIPEAYHFKSGTIASETNHTPRENETDKSVREPIAIIGLSGRYPGSDDVHELWGHLAQGDDLTSPISRWDKSQWSPASGDCMQGGFLNGIDQFDSLFFNISGDEAAFMDPNQRIFLEESWKALEDAGYAGDAVNGVRCGVFAGYCGGEYLKGYNDFDETPAQAMWGNAGSVLSARISYHLNLKGPAITVDTACSSSLVAIHLACQSLWSQETDLALAGGVLIQCGPDFYITANRASMLSRQGKCFTFDERAEGFVPGEGCGVVILKRLSEAQRDGDNIYGIIRGSGINQDGATNGITAPSALSQEQLEREVYQRFKISADSIQMVEAHGTGTRLGDPIEFEALNNAFRKNTQKKQYCAIGSIKTNMGHTAAAAGVAGVTKILLSLKHRKIPPSLHYETSNPHIDFASSPFYVPTKLEDWTVEDGNSRRAAISSFGFSGTNAHAVLEEAPRVQRVHDGMPGYLIVLSARTMPQLRQQAERLLEYCRKNPAVDCGNMSFTLLTGRKHFAHRLACVAASGEEFVAQLETWVKKGKAVHVYQTPENGGEKRFSLERYGRDCLEAFRKPLSDEECLDRLAGLAELFVENYHLPFKQLFEGRNYSRISLPPYPFARDTFWLPVSNKAVTMTAHAPEAAAVLHPLLHQNVSTLSEHCYSTCFTGKEFFLEDHRVEQKRVLPGVVYLEIICSAVSDALQLPQPFTPIRLADVVWAQPVVVDEKPVEIRTALTLQENGAVAYKVYTREAVDAEAVIHCQGIAELLTREEFLLLDLPELRGTCGERLNGEQCYGLLEESGIRYGTSHRGLEYIDIGTDAKGLRQVLGKVQLPDCVQKTSSDYVLHPSLMDASLQAAIGLMEQESGELSAYLPFAVDEVEIYSRPSTDAWVWVRYSESHRAGESLRRMHVDICDAQGRALVRMRNLTAKRVQNEAAHQLLIFEPVWQNAPDRKQFDASQKSAERWVIGVGNRLRPKRTALEEALNEASSVVWIDDEGEDIAERFTAAAQQLLQTIQRIMAQRSSGKILLQVVVSFSIAESVFAGLSGMLKTALQENAGVAGQLIIVETDVSVRQILHDLDENFRDGSSMVVRYEQGQRQIQIWEEIHSKHQKYLWKDGGIYLISGGAGGLGRLFAREIASRTRNASIVLIGRSSMNGDITAEVNRLIQSGARAEYHAVDVTDREAVRRLVERIQDQYGRLNGIIHTAGVLQDSLLRNKTHREVRAVLAPKVAGVVNLDEATRDIELDWMVFVSSLAGILGNIGQSDYATANAFLDAYAEDRNHLVAQRQRSGQTLSINWPFWAEGGMQIDVETHRTMSLRTGMVPLESVKGFTALYRAISSGRSQVLVADASRDKMRRILHMDIAVEKDVREEITASDHPINGELRGEVQAALLRIASSLLKVDRELLDVDAEMHDLGFDSIYLTKFCNELNSRYNVGLSVATLFEYTTISRLSEHLVSEQQAQIETALASEPAEEKPVASMQQKVHRSIDGEAETSALSTAEPTVLPPVRRKDWPLSFSQQRLWFLAHMEESSRAYHVPLSWRIQGNLDRTALQRALDQVVERHDVLRTTFLEVDGSPVQRIAYEKTNFPLTILDLRKHADVEGELAVQMAQEIEAPFDLEVGPLIRGQLLRIGEKEYVLLLTMHHIIVDGWSVGVLNWELGTLYDAYKRNGEVSLPPPAMQYAEYASLQRESLSEGAIEAQAKYWQQTLDGAPPLLMLPLDRPRPAQQDYVGSAVPVNLNAVLTAGLKDVSRRYGATLYMTLLAAWAVLLSRLSGQDEVVIGSPTAGRTRLELESLIGFFVNTLAIRVDLSGQPTFEEALLRVKDQTTGAQRNQDISFEKVVEALRPERSLSYQQVYQATMVWQNGETAGLELGDLKLERLELSHRPAKFDVSLDIAEVGGRIIGSFEYATALFERTTIERYFAYFQNLLSAIVRDPGQPIARLSMLPIEEREQVLFGWNGTKKAEGPTPLLLHEHFEAHARQNPEAAAIVFGDRRLSYGELNRQANQLARYLHALHVKPQDRVALCMERGSAMIAGLLAILKAEAVYVPFDPSYPEERLRFMLEDAEPVALLTEGSLQKLFDESVRPAMAVVFLDDESIRLEDYPDGNLERSESDLSLARAAYIIYTSGSTGRPKGVVVEHQSLSNLIAEQAHAVVVDAHSRVLQFASPSFDASVFEIAMALCHGGSLYLCPKNDIRTEEGLVNVIERNQITHITLPPAVLTALDHDVTLSSVRFMVSAGEAMTTELAKRWSRGRILINAYGPTEASIWSTMYLLNEWDAAANSVPIGRPIGNTQLYILDTHGEPVPIGVVGEIYIGGVGVARGYLNRPDLTAERFVRNPFVEGTERMYRTGDLGRWHPDGTIEFLGRNDDQVKIRGFRIELGEIEAQLLEDPEIREAVVLAREDKPGEKRLVVYYVGSDEVTADALRSQLQQCLPEYMVPAAYVRVEKMPLTPNGKLDRRALPKPESTAYGTSAYEAPVGEMETLLAQAFAEVLGLKRVGRRDNFFSLGGHSLLIVKLLSLLRSRGVEFDIRNLFQKPVVQDLAVTLEGGSVPVEVPAQLIPTGSQEITPEMLPLVTLNAEQIAGIVAQVPGGASNVQDIYPLAPLQEGIFFHYLLADQGDPYLSSGLMAFDSRERLDGYLRAMQAVVNRHDILRTAIFWEGLPETVQVVLRRVELPMEVVELEGEDDAAEHLYRRFDPRHNRINLRQAPLLRLYIAHDADQNRWLLMMLIHHVTMDHVSLDLLFEEVGTELISQGPSLAVPVPFRNYVAQTRLGVSREEQESFFLGMLGDVDEPTAPFGLLEVQSDGSEFVKAIVDLPPALGQRMRQSVRRFGVSTASLCHLAWATVLARVSGRNDVVFGTVLFGRIQGDEGIDHALGLYINTLPIRIHVGSQAAAEGLRQTHLLIADILRYEYASLALAQRASGVPAPTPLFSSLLNYRHSRPEAFSSQQALEGVSWLRMEERTNYPVDLSVDDFGTGFRLTAQTLASVGAERICAFMQTALESLVAALETAPETSLQKLVVLPEPERQRVLYTWNETEMAIPRDQCLHELFEEQVRRAPDSTALIFEGDSLSYAELNRRANRLAHYLCGLGVKPDDRVGLCVERGFAMIVGLLAILKSGAGYVPLDPAYPTERLRFMLKDARPVALLTQSHLTAVLESSDSSAMPMLLLDQDVSPWQVYLEENPDRAELGLSPVHLAYVIYTSGSTGTPKGVMIEHRNLINCIHNAQMYCHLEPRDRLLQFSSLSFDTAAEEIFSPLIVGAALVLSIKNQLIDPDLFWDLCRSAEVTVLDLPTRFWSQFVSTPDVVIPDAVRLIVIGGEEVSIPALQRWLDKPRHVQLLNAYGPTEVTITASIAGPVFNRANLSSIGRPIGNTQIYILDGAGEPVAIGVSGEIYIGGAGVGRGYLNLPDLTAERFVLNPFVEGAERMYRTGDLGFWHADGTVGFLGRNDHQVKIRGFRIELGEIEAGLLERPEIREAVVLAREDKSGDKRLVAYYVGAKGVTAEELRSHLQQQLPEYMVPAAYVCMETIPLTPNGKLDRRALPEPASDAYSTSGYEVPVREMETLLAHAFAEVLDLEHVGRHENFFELGGHSLLIVKLLSLLRSHGVELDIRNLFQTPTVMDLAATLTDVLPKVEIPPSLIPMSADNKNISTDQIEMNI